MSKKLLVIFLLLIVGGGIFLLLRQGSDPEGVEMKAETVGDEVVTLEEGVVLTAKLEDVEGGRSSGTTFVIRGVNLKHEAVARLPELVGNNFYEGWLVKQKPNLEFFSTGEMLKNTNGEYMLKYENDNLHEGYNLVVITLETKRDDVPEKHILEGVVR